MQLHELKREHPNKKKKTVGRGGLRGKTSGKGHKGQKARAGGTPRPDIREAIKRIPKLRGHGKNRARTVNPNKIKPEVVNVDALETAFDTGAEVSPATIVEKGLLRKIAGSFPKVKILGKGDLTKKFTVSKCLVSKTAQEKIEKAGGKIA